MHYYFDVWKKYAVFSGRARRSEYWFFVLFNFIAYILLGIIAAIIRTQILTFIYDLAILIPSIAVGVRRLHDIGKSGWWLFIGVIPTIVYGFFAFLVFRSGFSPLLTLLITIFGLIISIGAIVLLVFFGKDSQPGDNKYGPNPKGVSGGQGMSGGSSSMGSTAPITPSAPNTTPLV